MLFFAAVFSALSASAAWAGIDAASDGFGASIRTVGVVTRNYRSDALFGPGNRGDGSSGTILRLTDSRDAGFLKTEVHLVGSADWTDARTTGGFSGLSPVGGSDRYGSGGYLARGESGDWQGRLRLDRLNARLAMPFADLTLGKQAITFGQAYFWNPLDVFSPFDARSFDRDYKPGVTAVRLDIPLGGFAGINLVHAGDGKRMTGMYRNYCRDEQALLARMFAGLGGWDISIQGGRIYGGSQLGAGVAGELLGLEVRGESAWFWSRRRDFMPSIPGIRLIDDSFTGVAGLGRKVSEKVTVEAEYLYNGSGLPGNLDAAAIRMATGNTLHMGRHLAGGTVSWEALPLLSTRFAVIRSFSDGSSVFQPGLVLSVSDETELVAGAVFNLGRRPGMDGYGMPFLRSEFGSNPDGIYAEFKAYF